MTLAERKAIEDCGSTCEYWLQVAADAANRGRSQSSRDAREWAQLAAVSAFSVAESAR